MSRALVTLSLATAMAVATVSTPLVGVLAPLLRDELRMPAASVGLLVATYSAVSALASWPAGLLTDRVGGRLALTVVFAGSAVSLLGIASALSYRWLIGCMVVAGLANSMANPATNQVIAQEVPIGRRGLVAGVKMAGVQVAVFAVGLLIPFFAATVGWRIPLAVGGTSICLGGIAIALRRIEPSESRTTSQKTRLTLSAGLVALTVYSLLMSAGASASLTYLPLYTVDQFDAAARTGGLSVAVAGFFAIAGRLFWGRVTEQSRNATRSLLIIGLASAASSLLVLRASEVNSAFFWIGSAGLGFFALGFSAATTVTLILTVAKGRTGTASGVMFTGFMVGFGAGPVGFGHLAEWSGSYRSAWIGVTMAFGASVLVSLGAIRWETQERRAQPPSTA